MKHEEATVPPAPMGQVDQGVRRAREICIEWRMLETCGNGLWRPDTPDNRATLTAWAAESCARYGAGTHWIAERDA